MPTTSKKISFNLTEEMIDRLKAECDRINSDIKPYPPVTLSNLLRDIIRYYFDGNK